jgi:hypothetical protein
MSYSRNLDEELVTAICYRQGLSKIEHLLDEGCQS